MRNSKYLVAVLFLFATTAFGVTAYYFGNTGRDGSDGQSGYNGRDGSDVVLQATGQAQQLNLQGSDGNSASDGSYGEDARNCYQGRPDNDLVGASGGDGGRGGDGGAGGDGGSVRVYYQNAELIRQIYVDSTPGRGGYAGSGARGGDGCQCSDRSWRRRVCWDEKHYETICEPIGCKQGSPGCSCRTREYYKERCEDRNFYCEDGRDGHDGSSGSHGSDGRLGSIELVPRLEPLESTTPDQSIPVDTLGSSNFMLTRHDWDQKQGALLLFGSGSRIRNDYAEYAGKTIRTVSFSWMDPVRPASYFHGQNVSIGLSGRPATVDVDFSSGMLVDSRSTNDGEHTAVQIRRAMLRRELTQIRVEEMTGANQDLTLILIDDAKVSDIAKTDIFIKSGWDLDGGGEWKGSVPQDLIRSEEGKIYVNIGRLPGIKPSKIKKYFGDKCEFEMAVNRQFQGTNDRVVRDGGNVFDIEKDVKKQKPIKVEMENKDW